MYKYFHRKRKKKKVLHPTFVNVAINKNMIVDIYCIICPRIISDYI